MNTLLKSTLSLLFAVVFPLVVLPIGWLVRRIFDPLRLARPDPSLASHLLFPAQTSPKDSAHDQKAAHAR